MAAAIQHLKKVKLALLAGSAQGNYSLTPAPAIFMFLYGIGAQGLEPFEGALSGKNQGDTLTLTISASEAQPFFGHFWGPVRQLLSLHLLPEKLCLHITVLEVADAENREVVQALARSAGHGGCGGSCDCGCGSESC